MRAAWPEVRRTLFHDEADPSDRLRRPRMVAPPSDQDLAATFVLPWLNMIEDPRVHKVVAARVRGASWDRITAFDGRSRQHLFKHVYVKALTGVARSLERQKKSINFFRFTDMT